MMKIGCSIFIWLICIDSCFFTFRHFEPVRCCIQYVQNLKWNLESKIALVKNFYLFRYLTKFRFGIDGWIDVLSCDFSHHKLDISQFFEVKIALLNIELF